MKSASAADADARATLGPQIKLGNCPRSVLYDDRGSPQTPSDPHFFRIADNDGFNPVGTIAFSASYSAINGGVFGSGDVRFPSGTAEYDGYFFAIGGRT